ncbi:MAG: 3-oxoacyl-[acyl-carrier-protein] reductase [Proteobacteria bacterium]|jgi:3-oxoacyl-[acyl-carrier protein] reductase|nr:3-oxoacyl-[acyl-carrier-protein] reductase [Pseudomonadota bacterium]
MVNLHEKRALITGATSGIGAEILKLFVSLGAKCVASGTNEAKLAEIEKTGVIAKKCNIANPDEIQELVKFTEETLGGIDILICNAGITKDGLLMTMKEEQWDNVIDTNLKSSFLFSKAVIRKMIKQRYGKIVFISSVVGFTGNPGQVNYVASKSALTGMAKSIAKEVGSRGITVNCVAPGFIETPMTHVLPEEQSAKLKEQIALGRMGNPTEIANAVAFLASDAASYITGTTLHVNGGMY